MTKTSQTVTTKGRSKAFQEGVAAFKRGDSEDSCPYPSVSAGNNERTD